MGKLYYAGGLARKFGGRKYLLTFQRPTKGIANTAANQLRRQGWLVRVAKNPQGTVEHDNKWMVFRRSRTAR